MSKNRNIALVVGGLALGGYAIYKLLNSASEEKPQTPPHNPLDLPFPIVWDEGEQYDERIFKTQQYLNQVMELNEDGLSSISENGYYSNQFRNRLEYYMTNYIYANSTDDEIRALGYQPSMLYGRGDYVTEALYIEVFNSVFGCTDPTAFNYNPSANTDNGSCEDVIAGCMDSDAVNYNELANTNDSSCYYQPDFGG